MSIKFEQLGYIRVGNKRGAKCFQPMPDEKIISMDRSNKVFGNPHEMQNDSMQERLHVIESFRQDFNKDVDNKGPMWQEANNIARDIVSHNTKIIGMCWCVGLPCHAEVIVSYINQVVTQLRLRQEQERDNKSQQNLF